MSIWTVENIIMLLATVIGLFISVFRYIDYPKRGWLYVTGFFLAHFLSDYYWDAYNFVVYDDPDISAFMAYFGWNISFIFLLLAVLHMREDASKKFFHPLMLLPVPVNIAQVALYMTFGGYFNNAWAGVFLTAAAVFCLQSVIYYEKNKKNGARFPHFNVMVLIFLGAQFGMWTASCFYTRRWYFDPYFTCTLIYCLTFVFFADAVGRDYSSRGLLEKRNRTFDMRFRMMFQIITSIIIFGGCIGGLQVASRMKRQINAVMQDDYSRIAVTLFVISVLLVLLISVLIFVISVRFRKTQEKEDRERLGNSRAGFIATIILSFLLMMISTLYTSRLFYRVSVKGVYESGENTSRLVATEIENHLSAASSALQITADTVDLMMKRGESQQKLKTFLVDQTENQKQFFDENLTGFYGLLRGEYMDGALWVPPDDYDPKSRDWYKLAVGGKGAVILVPPYIDAQTGEVVITITRQISDYEDQERYDSSNVVAVDIIVNHVQDMVENTTISGKGVAMVVNSDGTIVAHRDRDEVGKSFRDEYSEDIFNEILRVENGTIDGEIDDEGQTLFVRKIMGQWYTVILISDTELLEESHLQLAMTITVSLVIFALISFFYYLSYRNEQIYSKRVEEMRLQKDRQEFEAKALALEKQAADEANKAKSSFLADMSHEIRTPINAILGMNEMILRESDNEDILEYAGNIDSSGRSLLQLINSILDFSKIEDGKMEIVPVEYELAPAIAYLVNSISERAKSKELEFSTDVDPKLPSKLFGDDSRIKQVVLNLLTNAVKYTKEGSVTLSVRQKERTEDAVMLHVEVKDTGIGIREEDMTRLFESFARLDQVKNRNIEGTGLGMSIVTKLLSLMDSSLNVDSVYGKGSTFSFDIWQDIKDEKPIGEFDMTTANSSAHNKNEGVLFAPDARILLTDDTKMNIMVVQKLLKRTGIQIDTADSGEKAIALADANEYDLILMDQRMPHMDGTEAMNRIRQLPSAKNVSNPVICLTADAIRGAKEKYMALGFTDYLTKPVDSRELENMLLAYLPKDKVQSAAGGDADNKDGSGDSLYDRLAGVGVDTEKGLEFCQEDEELYVEVLKEFTESTPASLEEMKKYYDSSDWGEYRVYAHSIKSSSRTIGATSLSKSAADLEAAADDGNESIIHEEHENVVRLSLKTVEDIKKALGV